MTKHTLEPGAFGRRSVCLGTDSAGAAPGAGWDLPLSPGEKLRG
jgi:hypothetical protein